MEREQKIVNNTILFTIGNILTKVINFIVMPLFTFFLNTGEFGVMDLIVSSSTVIIAIFSICIVDAVFRFTVTNDYDKKNVFSLGIIVSLMSCLFYFIIYTFLYFFEIPYVKEYGLIICFYLLFTTLHPVIHFFVKGLEKTKVFVINSVLYSFTSLSLSLLFVAVFNLGLNGYFLGLILAEIICCLYMVISCKLYHFFTIKNLDFNILKKMLAYSAPLIFNTIAWWVMGLSDKYIVSIKLGVEANGVLAISHKIPAVINMFYSIFYQAFIISALSDYDLKKDKNFFNVLFNQLIFILIVVSSFLIIIIEPVTKMFIQKSYYESWKFVPMMLLAAIFGSMEGFCGITYKVTMKNYRFALSTIFGGLMNFIVCYLMINICGLYAAALSTVLAELTIFIIRWVDTKKYLKLIIDKRNILNFILIIFQIILCVIIKDVVIMISFNLVLFLICLIINYKNIKNMFSFLLCYLRKSKSN